MIARTIRTAVFAAAIAALPLVTLAIPGSTPGQNSQAAANQKQMADARAEVEKAQKQITAIKKRVSSVFEAKEEWKTAKDAVKQAKTELDAAEKPVLDALMKKHEYVALGAKRDAAQAQIDEANKPATPGSEDSDKPKPDLAAASQAYTNAVIELKKMKKDALEEDSKVVAARQKYNDAVAAYEALQVQVDDAVKLDPEYPAAEQALAAAEERMKQTRESIAASAKAAREADAAAAKSKAQSHSSSKSSGYGR
jgi:chromosome segregation ATPase